ncbi:uncharacterized protein LOC117791342 [Drosophila innubila]|uniref:uncharacterized protein LOC117791342 n=1 Tax=Drosophila innubila TaxID=198719 RepID=UPI00148BFA4F|nr:uncharacterized protein LOC117791342 [Drosophila innubila]
MQKAVLIFLSLLALGHAATLYADADSTTSEPVRDSTTAAPVETTVADQTTADAAKTTVTADPVQTTVTQPSGQTTANPAETTVTQTQTTPVTTKPGECLYPTRAWGVPDLREFAFCKDGVAQVTQCNEDEYYVSNDLVSGCLPADKMDPQCVNLDITVGPCTGKNLLQPQPSETLTNFWFCEKEGAEPVECTCEQNKAFLKQGGYLGCFEWPEWRKLRGCQTY